MAERTLPGLGLTAFWDLGANGWNAEHDPDTRTVSVLCQCRVLSRATALPGSPTGGEVYLVPHDAVSNADEIAAYDDATWVYFVPQDGFVVFVVDDQEYVRWDDTLGQWVPVAAQRLIAQTTDYTLPAGFPCGGRVRMDDTVSSDVTIPAEATAAFPDGFWFEIEQVGTGQTGVVGAGAVVVNTPETSLLRARHCVVKVMKVGTDEWTLSGDIEPL